MDNSLILQDKNYISAKQVQDLFGYTSDYVGQLCRAGKLEAKMIGRSWFVTEKSIINYKTQVGDIIKQKNKSKRNSLKKLYKSQGIINTEKVQGEDTELHDLLQEIIEESNKNIEPIYSPLKAEAEQVNLIPLLKKNEIKNPEIDLIFNSPIISNVSPVHTSLALPFTSLTKRDKNKYISATIATLAIITIFIYGSINPINKFSIVNMQASIVSTSSEIIFSLMNKIRNVSSEIAGFFGSPSYLTKSPELVAPINTDINFQGIAVVPSTSSQANDEILKQKIRDSFSDEVRINPDKSGTAGIITPVFRKAKGDDFVYVLVPVNQK